MPPFLNYRRRLLMRTNTKAEQEIVKQREDRFDNVLFQCLEIMKMPEKWAMDKDNNIITVYPHPIVKREGYRVEGIQYLPHKSYHLPNVLLDRLFYWESLTMITYFKDAVKHVPIKKKRGRKPKVKDVNAPAVVGRPKKYTPQDVMQWVELREQGLSLREIAEITGVPQQSLSYYTRKYMSEAVAI